MARASSTLSLQDAGGNIRALGGKPRRGADTWTGRNARSGTHARGWARGRFFVGLVWVYARSLLRGNRRLNVGRVISLWWQDSRRSYARSHPSRVLCGVLEFCGAPPEQEARCPRKKYTRVCNERPASGGFSTTEGETG